MYIGAHISIADGLENAPERALDLGAEVMQIFTRSPQGGPFLEISEEMVKSFKENCRKFGIKNVYVHTPYFINLASKNNRIYYGSISSIRKELERASQLEAKYVMTHLGSAKDLGEEESIKKTIEGLEKIFEDYSGSAKLLIENSAGAGQIIGSDFKQIGKIFSSTPDFDEYLAGVCLDTQHSFVSGYNWKNNFTQTIEKIDMDLGFKNIKLIHSNDSLTDFNSRKDRHTHIGQGKIGLDGFEKLAAFAKENNIDMICETAYPGVIEDIKILKEMRKDEENKFKKS